MEEKKTELKMIKMSEVQSQEIEWLWYPFIPYGKLTIVQGDPGDGKTTLILNIAAKLSNNPLSINLLKTLCAVVRFQLNSTAVIFTSSDEVTGSCSQIISAYLASITPN